MCKKGNKQSPIDLGSIRPAIYHGISVGAVYGDLEEAYVDTSEDFIKVYFNSIGFVQLDESEAKDYVSFENFCVGNVMEFHLPSEHTFDGKHRDVELEILHDRARVSVFFDVEEGGNEWNEFIDALNLDKVFI